METQMSFMPSIRTDSSALDSIANILSFQSGCDAGENSDDLESEENAEQRPHSVIEFERVTLTASRRFDLGLRRCRDKAGERGDCG
jgi:hypothetical protein